jgi:hypothetical protein
MFWEEDIVVNNIAELLKQAKPGQVWEDVTHPEDDSRYLHVFAPLVVNSVPEVRGGRWGNKEGTEFANAGDAFGIFQYMFPLVLVNDITTASEKPLMDYDPTRGQWFVNEPDAPALPNTDFTQSFDTDLNLPDVQRRQKEVQISDPTRDNLQLAFSSLKLSWEEDPQISPQKALELLEKELYYSEANHQYIETIAIGETDAKKYFDPPTADIKSFSDVPEGAQFFSAEREIPNAGTVYDIIAIPAGAEVVMYLATGLSFLPVTATLKLSTPETYTDGDDFDQKKDEYDNRALQFRQEDSLSLVLPKDTLKGETDTTYFPSPKVYQDINENTGYADMAITASLKLSWEEDPLRGEIVELLTDWPLDEKGIHVIPAGTLGLVNELPGAQFKFRGLRVQLGVSPEEIKRVSNDTDLSLNP